MNQAKKSAIKLLDDQIDGTVRYVNILDAIISAIQSGNALPGEQLPTQRELAHHSEWLSGR